MARNPPTDTECGQTVLLPDRTRLQVEARGYGDGYRGSAGLCAIADVAVDTAVDRLGAGPIARRPSPAIGNSLAAIEGCTLLDRSLVGEVTGAGAVEPESGFAGWNCAWNPAGSAGPAVVVLDYYRTRQTFGSSGLQRVELDGRAGYVQPRGFVDDDGLCLVQIEHRPFTGPTGVPRVETILLSVRGPAPMTMLCEQATQLADAASEQLPPP